MLTQTGTTPVLNSRGQQFNKPRRGNLDPAGPRAELQSGGFCRLTAAQVSFVRRISNRRGGARVPSRLAFQL